MKATLKIFRRVANSSRLNGRAIVMGENGPVLGSWILRPSSKANAAALKAFRRALVRRYGTIGQHLFDTALGSRLLMRQPLRVGDVKTALLRLGEIRQNRYENDAR